MGIDSVYWGLGNVCLLFGTGEIALCYYSSQTRFTFVKHVFGPSSTAYAISPVPNQHDVTLSLPGARACNGCYHHHHYHFMDSALPQAPTICSC